MPGMRKLVVLVIITLVCSHAYAQRTTSVHAQPLNCITPSGLPFSGVSARTTSIGDTDILANISDTSALTIYSIGTDSGFVTGTNYIGDQAFAERYNFNGDDSSMQVLGVLALFRGTVNPASTKTVSFHVWSQSDQVIMSDSLAYNGFPFQPLDTLSVPITQLGINPAGDTMKQYMFPTPAICYNSFFVGYGINYSPAALNGDTIGLACSANGIRKGGQYILDVYINGTDTSVITVLNVQNAIQGSDGIWYDNYTQNVGLLHNFAIYPIVAILNPNGVKNVTRNDLTFLGSYPNPATNSVNIQYTLAKTADVTIQLMDIAGRVISTTTKTNFAPGQHITSISTESLSAGEYLYLIRTSAGDGVAGKVMVAR
jgi:hypothetical protein